MKKIKELLIYSFIVLLLLYLIISFLELELNPFEWTKEIRFIFIVISTGTIFGIGVGIKIDD